MKTTAICPISDRKIDEHVARFNGGFTLLFLGLYFITGSVLPVVFLILDFSLRSGRWFRFSLFSFLSKNITKSLALKPLPINAGPKIFAARIGVVFSMAVLLSALSGLETTTIVISAVFGTCAFLESVFGYCVACQIYPFVYKLTFHAKVQKVKI